MYSPLLIPDLPFYNIIIYLLFINLFISKNLQEFATN